MALGGKALDIMFDLYQRDFFKNIKSVMDMGDQDMYISFEEIKKNLNLTTFNLTKVIGKTRRNFKKDLESQHQHCGSLLEQT